MKRGERATQNRQVKSVFLWQMLRLLPTFEVYLSEEVNALAWHLALMCSVCVCLRLLVCEQTKGAPEAN